MRYSKPKILDLSSRPALWGWACSAGGTAAGGLCATGTAAALDTGTPPNCTSGGAALVSLCSSGGGTIGVPFIICANGAGTTALSECSAGTAPTFGPLTNCISGAVN